MKHVTRMAVFAILTMLAIGCSHLTVKTPDEWISEEAHAKAQVDEEFADALRDGKINVVSEAEFDKARNIGQVKKGFTEAVGKMELVTENGNTFLRMTSEKAKDKTQLFGVSISLPEGTESLHVRTRVRCKDGKWGSRPYMKAKVRVQPLDESGRVMRGGTQVDPEADSPEWKSFDREFSLPENAKSLRVFIGFEIATGIFDVDDVYIYAKGEKVKDYIKTLYRKRLAEATPRESDEIFSQGVWGKETTAKDFFASWQTRGNVRFTNVNFVRAGDEMYDIYARIQNDNPMKSASIYSDIAIEAGWEEALIKLTTRLTNYTKGRAKYDNASVRFSFLGTYDALLGEEVFIAKEGERWDEVQEKIAIPPQTKKLRVTAALTKATGTFDFGGLSIQIPGLSSGMAGKKQPPGHSPLELKSLNDNLDLLIKNYEKGKLPVRTNILPDMTKFDTSVGKWEIVHVDVTNGSDENDGTEESQVKTLSNAIFNLMYKYNLLGNAVKISIAPGVYREEFRIHTGLNFKKRKLLPIFFEAKKTGTVIISGADIFTGWKEDGGYYSTAWPYKFGPGDSHMAPWNNTVLPALYSRKEMMVMAGRVVHQVLTIEELATEGRFLIDEEKGKVYVNPYKEHASLDALNSGIVEIAVRPHNNHYAHLIAIVAWDGPVGFKGIDVTMTGSYSTGRRGKVRRFGAALNILRASDIYIADCNFVMNNTIGMGASGSRGLITNVTCISNGWRGLGIGDNQMIVDVVCAYNNWRGWRYGVASFDAAGAKGGGFNTHVRRLRSYSNFTHGLWSDVAITNILVEDCVLKDNKSLGLYFEISPGPLIVDNTVITGNKTGFELAESRQALVLNSVIGSNSHAQFEMRHSKRTAPHKGRRYAGEKGSEEPFNGSLGLRMYNSTIIVPKDSKFIYPRIGGWGGDLLVEEYHDHVLKTYKGDSNTYYVYKPDVFPIFDRKAFFVKGVEHATWRKHIAGGEEHSKVIIMK